VKEELTTLIPKDDLLYRLRANRDVHRALFLKALSGYRKKAIEELDAAIERIKGGSPKNVYVALRAPEDHTRDYDRVIEMIEMDVRSEIILSEDKFASYVQDDWTWKREFVASTTEYLAEEVDR